MRERAQERRRAPAIRQAARRHRFRRSEEIFFSTLVSGSCFEGAGRRQLAMIVGVGKAWGSHPFISGKGNEEHRQLRDMLPPAGRRPAFLEKTGRDRRLAGVHTRNTEMTGKTYFITDYLSIQNGQ